MNDAQDRLEQTAKALFQCAIDRADPARALRAALAENPLPPLPVGGRNFILAAGKAAVPMMRAALDLIPDPAQAMVITNSENKTTISGVEVICGSHPVPDENSENTGQAALSMAACMSQNDRLIALISGGGSALMVAPVPGLTLADKAAVNQRLLACGLDINQMNLIRQQLSALKGGGLLRAAAPAQVHSFVLSDVIGDDLRAIASGPTTAPIGTKAEARAIMQSVGIWEAAPETVRAHLQMPDPDHSETPDAAITLIGSNRQSLEAMRDAAPAHWQVQIVTDRLTGDVQQATKTIIEAARRASQAHPTALLFGGETTVQITGSGLGGRNQELALRIARDGQDIPGDWIFLSGGTDGRDGPTEAAGGIVTATTWETIRACGADPEALLADNDSNAALAAANALLMTGGTGTNVADVQIFLRLPG